MRRRQIAKLLSFHPSPEPSLAVSVFSLAILVSLAICVCLLPLCWGNDERVGRKRKCLRITRERKIVRKGLSSPREREDEELYQ